VGRRGPRGGGIEREEAATQNRGNGAAARGPRPGAHGARLTPAHDGVVRERDEGRSVLAKEHKRFSLDSHAHDSGRLRGLRLPDDAGRERRNDLLYGILLACPATAGGNHGRVVLPGRPGPLVAHCLLKQPATAEQSRATAGILRSTAGFVAMVVQLLRRGAGGGLACGNVPGWRVATCRKQQSTSRRHMPPLLAGHLHAAAGVYRAAPRGCRGLLAGGDGTPPMAAVGHSHTDAAPEELLSSGRGTDALDDKITTGTRRWCTRRPWGTMPCASACWATARAWGRELRLTGAHPAEGSGRAGARRRHWQLPRVGASRQP